jgi:DNA-binding MarR family transcriptional regulator
MRAGVGALLEFLEDEPVLATLCVVDSLGAGPRVLERRTCVVEGLIDAVDAGARARAGGRHPRRLVAEGVVGAVLSVLHARLMRGETVFADLHGPLTAIVVLPYLGGAAAEREASRPVVERRRTASSPEDPLRDLDMRLTNRTVQVLLAIAGRPGASNRQVADDSGVSDQGQISRLLARLEHLDLIGNSGAGPGRGEPNAWSLTHKGRQVERTIDRSGAATGDPSPAAPVARGQRRRGVGA